MREIAHLYFFVRVFYHHYKTLVTTTCWKYTYEALPYNTQQASWTLLSFNMRYLIKHLFVRSQIGRISDPFALLQEAWRTCKWQMDWFRSSVSPLLFARQSEEIGQEQTSSTASVSHFHTGAYHCLRCPYHHYNRVILTC